MKIFTGIYRYKIDAFRFSQMRENAGLSVEQFAAIIGWSSAYQYQLEAGKFFTVSEKTKKEICSAFFRLGIKIK